MNNKPPPPPPPRPQPQPGVRVSRQQHFTLKEAFQMSGAITLVMVALYVLLFLLPQWLALTLCITGAIFSPVLFWTVIEWLDKWDPHPLNDEQEDTGDGENA